MNKKIISASLFALCTALPAMAEPSAGTWDSTTGLMTANTSYDNSAVVGNTGVYSNTDESPVVANPWYNIIAGYYLPAGSLSAALCPAGKYCAGLNDVGLNLTADQGITGDIAAGYYSTGGATTATPTSNGNGCVGTNKYCGPVSGGYYSTGGGMRNTPGAGTVQGCLAGYYCGPITAGYYSNGGATSATPTAAGSGCLTGKDCGQCSTKIAGYTSDAGASSVTKCYKTGTVACSDVFPVDEGAVSGMYGGYTGGLYKHYSSGVITNGIPSSTGAVTTATCTSHLKSNGTAGDCFIDNPQDCAVTGVVCKTGFTETYPSQLKISNDTGMPGLNLLISSDFRGSSHGDSTYAGGGTNENYGVFHVIYGGGQEAVGIAVSSYGSSGNWSYDAPDAGSSYSSGTSCYCQIQSMKIDGKWRPYVSDYIEAPMTSSGCVYDCDIKMSNLEDVYAANQLNLYAYSCKVGTNNVVLNPNGAEAGLIQGKSISSGAVLAVCPTDWPIGSPYSGSALGGDTNVAYWGASGGANATQNQPYFYRTSITKANKIFIGWSDDSTCTSSSCVTDDTCTTDNQTEYYAVWATPHCTAGVGVGSTPTVKSISNNKVTCDNVSNTAGFFCPNGEKEGYNQEADVTVYCHQCPGYNSNIWTSTAGAATANTDCYRTITLNKNGGTGTHAATVTCNYNTPCDLGTANLTQDGAVFTGGWGTSENCSDTSSTVTITSVEENVTYYACKSAATIYIKWVDVAANPGSDFTAVSGQENAYTSTVSYGGSIITPPAGLVKQGQTFLGWRFVKSAQ